MAAPWVYIKDLKEHVGESVCVKGWMYNKRSSGKIHFLQLRDGSGTVKAKSPTNSSTPPKGCGSKPVSKSPASCAPTAARPPAWS